MKLPIIFMYSGQGSHYYQMGKMLFTQNKVFNHYLQSADQLFKEMTGTSVIEHLYSDDKTKSEPFLDLSFSHPSIFMVEYALTQVLLENNIRPSFILGSSIGEIAAGVIAGMLSFAEGLKTIVQQANIMKGHSQEGAMLAILAKPELYQSQSYLNQNSELAGINFPEHFVVSGKKDSVNEIILKLKQDQIAFQLLPVAYPFHSSLIDSAQNLFLDSVQSFNFNPPQLPLISCVQGEIIDSFQPNHLWEMIRMPILFQQTIKKSELRGPALYVDLGPSGTLATFVKYNLEANSKSSFRAIMTPFGNDEKNLESCLEYCKK